MRVLALLHHLSLEDAVAADLAGRGHLVWNVDYRPSDEPWRATLGDAAAATATSSRHLRGGVDPARVSVVGHSAAATSRCGSPRARRRRRAGRVEALSAAVVGQAPVASRVNRAVLRLGAGAAQALLGGHRGGAERRRRRPARAAADRGADHGVHAAGDDLVPISQSEEYVAAAGADARLVCVPGANFEHLDPASEAGAAMREALA